MNSVSEAPEQKEASANSQKEISSEQLEQIFSKIERTFYNQIMNSIPHNLRYIYAFLCTIAHVLT